jgi:L-ribulose-5-phosphate 3-epimerase UlaE
MAKIRFNEIKKNLREIVDNKKTKERVKIKALKQLSEITVQSLELSSCRDYVWIKKDQRGSKRGRSILEKENVLESQNNETKLAGEAIK